LLDDQAIADGVNLVERWLAGDEVNGAALEEAWAAARRVANTLEKGMVGVTAAQWAAIAVVETARCTAVGGKPRYAEALQAAAFAALYARAAGVRPSSEALEHQIRLADELFPAE
jgi:hypothetical protein